MGMLSKTEAELKKSAAYEKKRVIIYKSDIVLILVNFSLKKIR